MVEVVDLAPYWKKLADEQAFTEDEVQKLLKMAAHFQASTAYLADCQAATAESLPASTSKSARSRMATLCAAAAKFLVGDSSAMRFPSSPSAARARCLDFVRRTEIA